jgi:adenylate kinase
LHIIFLGAPGAGKGTQASVVSQELGLAHVASGDLFREALSKGTHLGLLAKSYMEMGQLVPDDITARVILDRIAAPDCSKGYILDGFPRTLEQARALDESLKENNDSIDKVVYIEVSKEELVARLSGRWICRNCQTPYHIVNSPPKLKGRCDRCGGELYQRPDDTEETVRSRLEVYFTQTVPLIDYYQKAGRLVTVKGEGGIEKVREEILTTLR